MSLVHFYLLNSIEYTLKYNLTPTFRPGGKLDVPTEYLHLDGNSLSTDDLVQLGNFRYKIKVSVIIQVHFNQLISQQTAFGIMRELWPYRASISSCSILIHLHSMGSKLYGFVCQGHSSL